MPAFLIIVFILWTLALPVQSQETQSDRPAGHNDSSKQYGPVSSNEALWDIADRIRPDDSISIEQMAVALFYNNTEAFNPQNINSLLAGKILNIPDKDQVIKISRQNAFQLFQNHWYEWQQHNQYRLDVAIEKSGNTDESDRQVLAENTEIKNSISGDIKDSQSFVKTKVRSNVNDTARQILEPQSDTRLLSSEDSESVVVLLNNALSDLIVYEWLETIKSQLNSVVRIDEIKQYRHYSPVIGSLLVIILFTSLVFYFRHQEKKMFISVSVNAQHGENQDTINTERLTGNTITEKADEIVPQEDNGIASRFSLSQQVQIDKSIKASAHTVSHQIPSNRKSILESAFDPAEFCQGTGFITEKVAAQEEGDKNKQIQNQAVDASENILDSLDEIRFVNEQTHTSKIHTFELMTSEFSTDSQQLQDEWLVIRDNEKIEVFIEEFEQIMVNLQQQASGFKKNAQSGERLENLLQFKVSIHFIKVLSEMMQTPYLYQFSAAVADYLQEIIDGKSQLNTRSMQRLLIVVEFYEQYITQLHCNEKSNSRVSLKVV